jgi:hypothetical protein
MGWSWFVFADPLLVHRLDTSKFDHVTLPASYLVTDAIELALALSSSFRVAEWQGEE